MLKKLADKMGVPYDKMPNNVVENFGNASGVSIPTCITYNMGEKLLKRCMHADCETIAYTQQQSAIESSRVRLTAQFRAQ